MAEQPDIVAAVDLGDHSVKCVVAVRGENGGIDVIGAGEHPADGFEAGECRVEAVARASLRKAVERAGLMAGCEISQIHLGISGRHLDSFNSDGMARIRGQACTREDLERAVDLARAVKIPHEQMILHVAPQRFSVDGTVLTDAPVGRSGARVEMLARVVVAHRARLAALRDLCAAEGFEVANVFCGHLARGAALASDEAREVGVAIIDLGSDTTEVAAFVQGGLVHAASLQLGGSLVSHDVRGCLNMPLTEAEALKTESGHAVARSVDADAMVEVPAVGGRPGRSVTRRHVAEIIEARVQEILDHAQGALAQAGLEQLPGGVILTGGGANLDGIVELADQSLRMPCAVPVPHGLSGLVDVVSNPRYATAVGVARCALDGAAQTWFSTPPTVPAARGGFWGWLKGR